MAEFEGVCSSILSPNLWWQSRYTRVVREIQPLSIKQAVPVNHPRIRASHDRTVGIGVRYDKSVSDSIQFMLNMLDITGVKVLTSVSDI
jgi:hypothetical protein